MSERLFRNEPIAPALQFAAAREGKRLYRFLTSRSDTAAAADEERGGRHYPPHILRARRLVRVFHEQVEIMATLKGKGSQQRVMVEHVTVAAGGQAIVR